MKRRVIWIVALVVVLAGTFLTVRAVRARSDAGKPKLDGEPVAAERGVVRKSVSADGTLRALTTVDVKSYAGGKVEVLAVELGDRVKAGDLVAVIDPTDSRTTHQQAVADLTVAKANLSKALANMRVQRTLTDADIASAVAGQTSAVTQLAQLQEATQPRTRAEAKAAVEEATASLDAALKDLDRIRDASQPQSRTEAQSSLERYTAAVRTAQKELESLKGASQPQTVVEMKVAVDRARAARDAAKESLARLEQAGHPQARVEAQGNLARTRSQLEVAAKELERMTSLREKGFVSKSELEAAQSSLEAAQAEYNNAEEATATIGADQASQIRAAQLTVAQYEADLQAAEERWRQLAPQQSAELEAAQAKLTQARADLAAAEKKWTTIDNQQSLELRVAEAKVVQAQASLSSAQERWRILDREQQTETEAQESRVAEAQAALLKAKANAVENELRKAEADSARASVVKAQAQVQNAAIMLGYTTIVAPRDGVILTKSVEEGTIITSGRSSVTSGTTLVQLGDLSRIFADVQVDEANLGDIQEGQRVETRVEAYSEESVEGKVTKVAPLATTTSNVTTVLVEVEIQHPDERFLPGLTVSCDFVVAQVEDALFVPRRAVANVANGEGTVKVMQPDGTATETPVKVGLQGDDSTEILEGLTEGTSVLLPRLGAGIQAASDSHGKEMGRRMGGGGFTAGGR